MKIDRSERRKTLRFSDIPTGTVFSFYEPHIGGDLYLKIKPITDSSGRVISVICLSEDRVAIVGDDALIIDHPNAKIVIE